MKNDINGNFCSLLDLNNFYTTKTDLNANFIPYIGADYDLNMGIYSLKASDSNFTKLYADWLFGYNGLFGQYVTIGNGLNMETGLGVGDLNVQDNIYSSDIKTNSFTCKYDANFSRIESDFFYGDGSGLTNVSASTNWADINAHLVPYNGADYDVNLGVYKLQATNVFGIFDWINLAQYPDACAAGEYVSAVGDTLTCSAPSGSVDTDTIRTYTGTASVVVNNDTNTISLITDFNTMIESLIYQFDTNGGIDTDTIRTYTGVGPIVVENDVNQVSLNVLSTSDWNGLFDGQEGSYYLSYLNLTSKPSLPVVVVPWTDANIWRYIPSEANIDNNASTLDANITTTRISGNAFLTNATCLLDFNVSGRLNATDANFSSTSTTGNTFMNNARVAMDLNVARTTNITLDLNVNRNAQVDGNFYVKQGAYFDNNVHAARYCFTPSCAMWLDYNGTALVLGG
jgi:hypothetical protein